MRNFYRSYLLPGLLFQSVITGGGYATGRELIEFFGAAGPWGGLLGMAVTTVIWSAVLAVSFELVRLTRSYDYRSFMQVLIGPGWILYELAYFALLVLVMSVIGSATGEVMHASYGVPKLAGTLTLIGLIAVLVYFHNEVIETILAGSAIALLVVYAVLIWSALTAFGDDIATTFEDAPVQPGWLLGGITYSAYNVAAIPSIFFCLHHLRSRRQALGAGLLGGPLAMVPAMLFFAALMAFHPEVLEQPVPSTFLLAKLDARWSGALLLHVVFEITLLWTLLGTGVGLLHAVNERIAKGYTDRGQVMPRGLRSGVSLLVMVVAVFASQAIGLIGLIAKGYGWLTWAFIVVLVIPVLTLGVWKIMRLPEPPAAPGRDPQQKPLANPPARRAGPRQKNP